MQYNTQRPKLLISEYGRIIQNMAREAAKIEDREQRNATAKVIIELMSQASPAFKSIEEYKHKLWDHLIMISDFKLVVDSPLPFSGTNLSGSEIRCPAALPQAQNTPPPLWKKLRDAGSKSKGYG